ncbi:efflux RND transporter periplasmic adaptor subunit [Oleiharenicola lentus]|uniref:efflux RND transporter periplasmic adaptor subunit n=1 Tax=Oleiharenicola lentus TaxID=2508720 RepID=UPI003F66CA22
MNTPESSLPTTRHRLLSGRFRRRSLFAIAGVLGFSGAAAYVATRAEAAESDAASAAAPAGPTVTVAPVEEKLFVDQRELLGRVDAREAVEIRPRVSGHIAEVRLQSGQLVKAGDVLFVIDRRWYQAQFDLATAQVDSARVRFNIAEREAKRIEALLVKSVVSVEEADTRTTRLAEARAELRAAEATLATARLDLEHTEVRAPIAGRVSRAYVTAGNLVSGAPGGATLLTSIVSTGDVYVYADVDENTVLGFNRLQRAGRIITENGRVPVEMQLSDESGFTHRGYVESSDNRLDPATGSLVVRFVFPNDDGQLVPGLFARVRLPVSAAEKTMFVSERAIGTDQSQKFVLTVDGANTVAYRAVKLGPLIEGQRVVRDGLKPGERIIVNGLQRARPGMTVVAENAAPASKPKPATSIAQN